MSRIANVVKEARKLGKYIYIRGITDIGIYLGIYFDWENIPFVGYVDRKSDKWGKVVYGDHICYAPSQLPENSFVFIATYAEKVQNEIALELQQKRIAYIKNLYKDILKDIERIDDEFYLRSLFEAKLGYKLDLENPRSLCEKLQWLKLYDRNPLYTKMVDKYEVKEYVKSLIGEQYVLPALGVWECVDEINFDELPNEFVLKKTNDSGSIIVIDDKEHLDIVSLKKKLAYQRDTNYYYHRREWPYKNVKPRIIAEKYVDTLGKPQSIEYKVTCFNGKVGFVTICRGIAHVSLDVRTNDSYDTNFNHMPWYAYYKNSAIQYEKPKQWNELIALSEKLATNIPYVRVDWYVSDEQLYFGEITFYTWAGFIEFTPPEWDLRLGDCLTLPKNL